MNGNTIGRREFLRSSAILLGGLTVAACADPAAMTGAEPSMEPIELRYHHRLGLECDDHGQWVEKFNEDRAPDVSVTMECFPPADYFQKLNPLIAGGTIGDAFWISSIEGYYRLAAAGASRALDDLVESSGFDLSDFYALNIEAARLNGELYGLPQLAHPGRVGLFIAAVLAAVMSSCDAFMVCSAALFTENIYRPHIRSDRSEKHYVLVGRLTSIAVVAGGILLAFELPSVVDGLELVWIVQAMMGVSIWFSFFWRRATAAAAWASTLAGFATWFLTSTVQVAGVTLWDFNSRFGHLLPDNMLIDGVLSLPWQMLIYLSVAAVVMVVVSLVTTPPPEERLNSIYATLRTPVATDEPEVAPLTLPEGVEPVPRDPLIDLPGFEVMKPSLSGVVGFIVCSGLVAGLIWFFAWIIG